MLLPERILQELLYKRLSFRFISAILRCLLSLFRVTNACNDVLGLNGARVDIPQIFDVVNTPCNNTNLI